MSTDSRFTHKIWDQEELSKMVEGGIPFPMFSDQGGRIGDRVRSVRRRRRAWTSEADFIIDPDGVIQAMEVLTPQVGRNVSRVDPSGQSLPARAGHRRGHAVRLAAGQTDPQAGARPGRQGVEGMEAGDGFLEQWRDGHINGRRAAVARR